MSRPVLEVADIFCGHGPAWRQANAGHVGLGQLKVMSAIENCRTAALGGHVARCENETCAYTQIAYNSCRNRHCPKCQGTAAREWLAEREAELLPVPYFHVVFSLPAQIADIAYQNKAVIYDILFKASAETMIAIAADPKHLGARIGVLSVLHTWGSALTHHPHVHMIVPGGGISLDRERWVACRPNFFLPVRVLSRLFRRLVPRRTATVLRQAHCPDQCTSLCGLSGSAARQRMGRLQQTAVRWPPGSVALSRALHPPRRHLQPAPGRARRQRRHLQPEGLPHRRSRAIQVDNARYPRVHPPLPDACLAARLPPYPLLRLAHEPNPRQEDCPHPRAACRAIHPDRCHQGCQRQARRAKSVRASLSLLRRPHAHHRDLLAGETAEPPPLAGFAKGQDRPLMMPTPVLDTHGNTHRLCWLLPDSAPACRVTPDGRAITTKKHKISSLKM